MELLYFWIKDDFKTLKDCGLDFSSQFKFAHKFDVKEKYFELTIDENPKYISGFFSSNISNLTAIIGDNGVGKSNILELLIDFLTYDYRFIRDWVAVYKSRDENTINLYYDFSFRDSKFDLRLKNRSTIQVININEIKVQQRRLSPPLYKNLGSRSNTKVVYYSPILDFRNYPPQIRLDQKNPINVSTNFLMFKDSESNNQEKYDNAEFHKLKNIERQLELSISPISNLKEINIPKEIEVRIEDAPDIYHLDLPQISIGFYYDSTIKTMIAHSYTKLNQETDKLKGRKKDITAFREKVKHYAIINIFENYLLHLEKIKDHDGKIFKIKKDDIAHDDIIALIMNFFKLQKWVNFNFIEFIELLGGIIDDHAKKGFDSFIDRKANFIVPSEQAVVILEWNLRLRQAYLKASNSQSFKEFNHFNWRNISSGEKAYLDLYSRLNFAYNSFVKEDKNTKHIYLFIDEGEHGFHPKWQKKYINNLIRFLELLAPDKTFQLILTTHSPIIVSDLPKSNIIFLEKNNNPKAKISDLENHEQTFGANIHSLFSDAFFMGEGLMGEFAKKKIEGIYSKLNKLKNDKNISHNEKEKIRKQIDIIGEPLIRDRLLSRLNELTLSDKYLINERKSLMHRIDEIDSKLNL